MTTSDLMIIGGGPGGYVAAIRGRQLGLSVTLVEKDELGGVCLNWGCIPTKALLKSAEICEAINHASDYGLEASKPKIHLDKIVERSRKISSQLSQGIKHLMKKNGVNVVSGVARLKGPGQVDVDGKTLSAKHIILATGARARTLPGIEPDGKLIWTAREAMVPDALPESLLIIGSGAIGIEFASFYRSLGVNVTVVEVLKQILPQEDPEIALLAQKALEKRGIKIMTEAQVSNVVKKDKYVEVTIAGQVQKFDRLILAVGVTGNIENLGLEKTKVKTDRGFIVTQDFGVTDEAGIYAIGDVAGAPCLAHKASHEGVACVEKIAGQKAHSLNRGAIPGCTYSTPQIASIGLTEDKAKAAGHKIKVGRFPFRGNGKALALGEPDGLVKTVFDETTGRLLGAHMIGAEVTELVQGFAIAMTLETTEEELMQTIFPHPTLSEMMHESVLDAFGRVIHF